MRKEIVVTKAVTPQDFAWAAQLRTEVYYESGYLPEHNLAHTHVPAEKKETVGNEIVYLTEVQDVTLPSGHVVGTVSLTVGAIASQAAVLHCFPAFSQRRFAEGRHLLYVGSLAILQKYRCHRGVVMSLIKATVTEAVEQGAERVLCAVHPKHHSFYATCLGFVQIDQRENMPGLINAPAILLEAAVSEVSRRLEQLTKQASCFQLKSCQ